MFRLPRSSVVILVLVVIAVFGMVPAATLAQTTGADPVEATVIPPRVLHETQKAPTYPPAALAARFTGTVVVKTRILADGKVGHVEVVECDHPNLGFEAATIDAVKKWRFKPALKEGTPVDFTRTFKLNFGNAGPGSGLNGNIVSGEADVHIARVPAGATGPR